MLAAQIPMLADVRSVEAVSATITAGDATPDVSGADIFTTANVAPTTITAFDNPRTGIFVVIFGDSNTTVQHGASLQLMGGYDATPSSGARMLFAYDGSVIYELSRNW